ncbi:hypothetical protein AVEN_52121-1 [Araneus ventricosus]|uniref:Uncharacterized protein n=1 Tax=Araneus ventricosus TaxID=182803 RepID=A0A4Y2E6F1_ARAVE|nr:hypothetical protein AVEN_52121-1 [Araneus ventricosus]
MMPRNQQIRFRGFINPKSMDSQIRFRGFITNPIPRIRSFWSESDPVVPFEESDPRIRSGVNDTSLTDNIRTLGAYAVRLYS